MHFFSSDFIQFLIYLDQILQVSRIKILGTILDEINVLLRFYQR